jgi:hypothetical protein
MNTEFNGRTLYPETAMTFLFQVNVIADPCLLNPTVYAVGESKSYTILVLAPRGNEAVTP